MKPSRLVGLTALFLFCAPVVDAQTAGDVKAPFKVQEADPNPSAKPPAVNTPAIPEAAKAPPVMLNPNAPKPSANPPAAAPAKTPPPPTVAPVAPTKPEVTAPEAAAPTAPVAPKPAAPVAISPMPAKIPGIVPVTAPTAVKPSQPAIATLHVVGTDAQIATAETKALQEGQERAFAQIIRSRDPDRATGILKKITPADRAMLIKTVSAQNELRRAGHYEADVTYAFDAERVDALVTESKGLVPELSNDSLLVLPVWDAGDHLLVFEPQNQWRQVLNRQSMEQGHGKLIVPFGDPKDAMIIDANIVALASHDPMAELARRYGTANLVIATAKLSTVEGKPSIEVRLRRLGEAAENVEPKIYTATGPGEKEDALLGRAARETAIILRDGTARFSLFSPPDAQKLKGKVVRAEFLTSRDWTTLRDQMKSLPGVEFTDIGAISAGFAQLTFYYRGDPQPIRQALEGRGLKVSETGEFWTVRLR